MEVVLLADPGFTLLSPTTGRHCRDLELPPVLANQMHPDSKLTNHGKTGNSSAQPQQHNVSQPPPCNLGAKGVGAGSHGGKVGQPPPGSSGLKPAPAPVPPAFGALKGKVKRERSVSVDSGERREARAASLGKELKGEEGRLLGWDGMGWAGQPAGVWAGVPIRPLWTMGGVPCLAMGFRLFFPSQGKWLPGASGAACWRGSSPTVGTSGAPAPTARTMRRLSAAPTVSLA